MYIFNVLCILLVRRISFSSFDVQCMHCKYNYYDFKRIGDEFPRLQQDPIASTMRRAVPNMNYSCPGGAKLARDTTVIQVFDFLACSFFFHCFDLLFCYTTVCLSFCYLPSNYCLSLLLERNKNDLIDLKMICSCRSTYITPTIVRKITSTVK